MNKIRAELIRAGKVRPAPSHADVRSAVVSHGMHNDVQAARVRKAIAVLEAAIQRERAVQRDIHG